MPFQKGNSIRRGAKHSEDTKKKLSEARTGVKMTDETKKKISESIGGANHPMYGKHHSEETKKKLSVSNTGKKLSEETKKKISESLKGCIPWNKGVDMWADKTHPMTGKVPGNKGTPRTEEVKTKISVALTGTILSDEHRANISKNSQRLSGKDHPMYGKHLSDAHKKKIGDAERGDKHHNWKGGITPTMNAIRTSRSYNAWRQAVFKRDNYTCQLCAQLRGDIQAHHIEPVRDHKNDLLIFDINNGITLCERCHGLIYKREHEFIERFKELLLNKR